MAIFDSQFDGGLDMLFEQFAETVSYHPRDGAARTISAVVTERGKRLETGAHHQSDVQAMTLLVRRDAADGITAPQLGDAVRLASEDSDVRWDFLEVAEEGTTWLRVRWQRHTIRKTHAMRPSDL